MPQDLIVKLAIGFALIGSAFVGVWLLIRAAMRGAAEKARRKDVEAHREEHDEAHRRLEEYRAGGGLRGGMARARRLRDAERDRDV